MVAAGLPPNENRPAWPPFWAPRPFCAPERPPNGSCDAVAFSAPNKLDPAGAALLVLAPKGSAAAVFVFAWPKGAAGALEPALPNGDALAAGAELPPMPNAGFCPVLAPKALPKPDPRLPAAGWPKGDA